MRKIIHRADSRGIQDHGWLKAAHSFSFGHYHDPSKMHFGLLKVLNDDVIAPGKGFGMHSHDNMEIVTIPLRGSLAHKDSLGSTGNITEGEVQIMSAGSGIQHSEFNGSLTEEVNLLQIWVFPKKRNINPRYDQRRFDLQTKENEFVPIVSSAKTDEALWINQDSVFSLGIFIPGCLTEYAIRFRGNGAYIFVIEGKVEIGGEVLNSRDAVGLADTDRIKIFAAEASKLLIIEVPME